MSRGERIGFAIMYASLPVSAMWGLPGFAMSLAGSGLLLLAQRARHRTEPESFDGNLMGKCTGIRGLFCACSSNNNLAEKSEKP